MRRASDAFVSVNSNYPRKSKRLIRCRKFMGFGNPGIASESDAPKCQTKTSHSSTKFPDSSKRTGFRLQLSCLLIWMYLLPILLPTAALPRSDRNRGKNEEKIL